MAKEYYECFSENLYNYLIDKGFKSIRTYKHNKTKVTCHVFKITKELSEALYNWSKVK